MSVFKLLIYFVSCSLDYLKSQLGSKKTTFISAAYQENVRKSSIKDKENRIYIRWEFTSKKCKTVIFLYCFHTAGVLHIFMLYNLMGPGISF